MIGPFTTVDNQIRHYFPAETHPYRKLENRVMEALQPDYHVLDIGCGRTAPNLAKLRGKAAALYGIDLVEFGGDSDDLILIDNDVSDLKSFEDESINLAYSRSVMEHVADAERAYSEIFRVLKPGAKYIFLTPNRYDYASILATIIPNRFHGKIVRATEGREEMDVFPTCYQSNSFTRIRKLAKQSGFTIVDLERLGQYPNYLAFNRSLFWIGCMYEKMLEMVPFLDCMKGWIFCEIEKPSR